MFLLLDNKNACSYYMDTYRTNAAPEAMQREGQKALEEIAEFKPDSSEAHSGPRIPFFFTPHLRSSPV